MSVWFVLPLEESVRVGDRGVAWGSGVGGGGGSWFSAEERSLVSLDGLRDGMVITFVSFIIEVE